MLSRFICLFLLWIVRLCRRWKQSSGDDFLFLRKCPDKCSHHFRYLSRRFLKICTNVFIFLYKKYRRYTDVVLGSCSSGIRDTTFFSGCIRKSGDFRPYMLQEKRKQRDSYDRKQRRDERTLRHDGFSFLILDAEQGSVRSYGHGSQYDVDVGNGGVNPA